MKREIMPYMATGYDDYGDFTDWEPIEDWQITGRWRYVDSPYYDMVRMDVEIKHKKTVRIFPDTFWGLFTLKPYETATLTTLEWIPEERIKFSYREQEEIMECGANDYQNQEHTVEPITIHTD